MEKEMVLIPAGEYLQGSEHGYQEEKPVHKVKVHSFYMDKYLVTNREYKGFCDATGRAYPPDPRWKEAPDYFLNFPDHPVINVSWCDAREYADWAGKRLPTEEEWEYAAHGGLEQPDYPWGDEAPEGQRANYADRNTEYPWRDFRYSTGYQYTSPVGSYPANGYGLYDMAGNIWEWCIDWFFLYSDTVRSEESLKDGWGGSKVCRGGCYHSSAFDLRAARRRQVTGGGAQMSVGFRCVRDTTAPHAAPVKVEQAKAFDGWEAALKNERLELKDNTELCLGVGDMSAEAARSTQHLGFTSLEQYVTWESIENNGKDQWDFSKWDQQVAIMRSAGLKWMPFLIAGPAYSLPDWYRASSDFEGLHCLEHNIESKVQSIWDEKYGAYVERFLQKVADHYGESGALEAVLLGITGDFGEAIFPDWHGNWTTQIPGLYHSHAAYWCGDRFARQHFRKAMARKFGDIGPLNIAWGTKFPSLEAVVMPDIRVDPVEGFRVDEHTQAGRFEMKDGFARRRWIDFVDWYRQSMAEYADLWMGLARKHFPGLPVYLCTGGYAQTYHSSEFSMQCKVAARHGGGIRITNEASNYANNFVVTNWVSSAGTFYGTYYGFEPAGDVTEKGVAARIYNATASGARELHFYGGNVFGSQAKMEAFARQFKHLRQTHPEKEIGVLYPDTPIMLGDISHLDVVRGHELLRDYTDFWYVDDLTIQDGILSRIKCLIVCTGTYYRKATLEAIQAWVEAGGLLVGYNLTDLISIEEDVNYTSRLFAPSGGEKPLGKGFSCYLPLHMGLKDSQPGVYLDTLYLTYMENLPYAESPDFYQAHLFQPITDFFARHGFFIADGKLDRIYTAQVDGQYWLLNTHDSAVEKEITLKDGGKVIVTIEGNDILRMHEAG
jgi:sulfatase modifying factor 1